MELLKFNSFHETGNGNWVEYWELILDSPPKFFSKKFPATGGWLRKHQYRVVVMKNNLFFCQLLNNYWPVSYLF